jgi:hypothetical protein
MTPSDAGSATSDGLADFGELPDCLRAYISYLRRQRDDAVAALSASAAEVEALKHDLERQMTIANEYVNEVEALRAEVQRLECELGINPARNTEIAAAAGKPITALKASVTPANFDALTSPDGGRNG